MKIDGPCRTRDDGPVARTQCKRAGNRTRCNVGTESGWELHAACAGDHKRKKKIQAPRRWKHPQYPPFCDGSEWRSAASACIGLLACCCASVERGAMGLRGKQNSWTTAPSRWSISGGERRCSGELEIVSMGKCRLDSRVPAAGCMNEGVWCRRPTVAPAARAWLARMGSARGTFVYCDLTACPSQNPHAKFYPGIPASNTLSFWPLDGTRPRAEHPR